MAAEGKDVDVNDQQSPAGITADVGGISLMQRLRIPFVVSVFDEYTKSFLPVGNRQTPVGLANIEWNGLFVTSDEQAALEGGTPSNASWVMGFMIDSLRGELIRREYPELQYPVSITIGGTQSVYFRNFPLEEYSIQAVCGYLSFREFDYTSSIQARSLDVSNSTNKDSLSVYRSKDEDDNNNDFSGDNLPLKKLQHMKSPFSLANMKTWWTWYQENHQTQQITVETVACAGGISLMQKLRTPFAVSVLTV